MRVKSYRSIALPFCILVASCLAAPMARAAYTNDFDGLRAELESRSLALSNSTDKIDIKTKKLCDQAIALIDKPASSLATDIKTAKKVAGKMIKAFPDDFILSSSAIESLTFSNIVPFLLTTYYALGADVQSEIGTLTGLIDGLPDGTAKTKAQAAFNTATNLIALAQTPGITFAQAGTLLGKSLKAALKGQQIAIKAGGGGGTSGWTASVMIAGTNDNFVATSATAGYSQSFGNLDLNAQRSGVNEMGCVIPSGFTGTTGSFPLDNGLGFFVEFGPPLVIWNGISGTLNITTFDLATHTIVATFDFVATNGMGGTITVTNGMINLDNLTGP